MSPNSLWEIETSLIKGTHKISCALGHRAKVLIWEESGPDLCVGLGESPREVRGGYSSSWGHRHWQQPYWELVLQHEHAAGSCLIGLLAPRSGPTQQPISTSARTPQVRQLTEWGHSTHQQAPKDFLSPLDILLHTALPTRGPRPNSTHQWSGPTLSPRKPSLASRPASPTRGQTPDRGKPQSRSLGPKTAYSRLDPNLVGHWPCPLAGQHKLYENPDPIPNYVRKSPSPPQRSNMSSGIPGPCSQTLGTSSPCQ